MFRTRSPRRALPLVALLVGIALSGLAAAEDGQLRAGLGSARLPAPEGGPLGGYGGLLDRTATGTLDPPEARALVLEQGDLRVALISVDLVISRLSLRDRLLEPAQALGIDTLILVATHTHSGPGGYVEGFLAERVTSGEFSEETPVAIAEAARQALEQATQDLAPARAASVSATLELAQNRRFDDGARETQLPVLRLDRADALPILVFAYGMHAIIRSNKSTLYSADFIGVARQTVQDAGMRPMFLPGPLGDQSPTSQIAPLWSGDLELEERQTQEVGGALGQAVLQAAAPLQTRADVELAALERWVKLPEMQLRRFCPLWWVRPFFGGGMERFLEDRVPIQIVQLGHTRLLALPAEPTSAVGTKLRAALGSEYVPFVVAHANDWIGYVVQPDVYERGGYESCLSFHGPQHGPWLVEEAAATSAALEARDAD